MASIQFVVDTFKKHLLQQDIDMVNDTIKAALCSTFSPSYSAWSSSTSYSEGDIVIPSTRNGHRYRATNGGTSASSEPTWPTAFGDTVVDNNITWEEYGGEHADNEFFNDVYGNELAGGDGYTEGGEALSSLALTLASTDPAATRWDAADVTWSGLSKTFMTAWLYVDGDTPGTNDYLISYILLDDTFSSVSINGVDFTLKWNTAGILELAR